MFAKRSGSLSQPAKPKSGFFNKFQKKNKLNASQFMDSSFISPNDRARRIATNQYDPGEDPGGGGPGGGTSENTEIPQAVSRAASSHSSSKHNLSSGVSCVNDEIQSSTETSTSKPTSALLDSGLSRDASDTGHTEEGHSEVCSTSSEEITGKDCGAPIQKTAVGYSASSGIDKSDEDSLGMKSSRNDEPPPILHRAKTFTLEGNYEVKHSLKSAESQHSSQPSILSDDDETTKFKTGTSPPSSSTNRRRKLSNFYKPDKNGEVTLLTVKPVEPDKLSDKNSSDGKYSSDDQKQHLETNFRSRSPTRRNKKITLAKSKTQDNLKLKPAHDNSKMTLPRAARLAPQVPPDRDKTSKNLDTDTKNQHSNSNSSSEFLHQPSSNQLKLTPKLTPKLPPKPGILRRASDRPVSLRIPARNVPNTQYEDWLFIKKTSALLRRNSSKKLKNEKISRSNSQNKESRIGRTVYVKYWCVLADSCLYCYTSPHSDSTDHCLMLRGYYTVTNLPDIPQFGINLTHPELPSIRVKLETSENFTDWVQVFDDSLEDNINHTPMMRSVSAEAPSSRRKRSLKLKNGRAEKCFGVDKVPVNSRSNSHQPRKNGGNLVGFDKSDTNGGKMSILSDKIKSSLNRKELNSLDIRRQSIMLKFNALNHEQKQLASKIALKSEKIKIDTIDFTEKSRQKLLDDKISRLKAELKNCESEIEERKHGTVVVGVSNSDVKPPDINSFLIEQQDYLSTIHSKTIQARQRSANSRLESRIESTTDTSSSSEQIKRRAKSRDYDTSLKRQVPISSSKSHNSKILDSGKTDSKSPDSSSKKTNSSPDSNSKKTHSNGRIFFGKTGIFQNNSVPPDTKSILKNSRKNQENEHQQPPLSSVKNPPDKVEKFSENSAGGNVRRKSGSFDEIEEFEKFSKTILAKFNPK